MKWRTIIVDATTATPYLINALAAGADIVIHSSSKYIMEAEMQSVEIIVRTGGKISMGVKRDILR